MVPMQSPGALCFNGAFSAAAPSQSLDVLLRVECAKGGGGRRKLPTCTVRNHTVDRPRCCGATGRFSCGGSRRFSRVRRRFAEAEVAEVEESLEGEMVGKCRVTEYSEVADKQNVDLRALVLILRDMKTPDDVEAVMKGVDGLLLPGYCSMVRSLGMNGSLDAAFAVVEYLKRTACDSQLRPNVFIYNSLLSAVKQTRQFERVKSVLADMENQGISPNIVTFNTLIAVYVEQGLTNDALGVLEDIERNGLSPSPVTHSTVLLVYKGANDADGALRYFSKLREKYVKNEIEQCGEDWEMEFVKFEKLVIRISLVVIRRLLVNEGNPTEKVLNMLKAMDEARVVPIRTDYERLVWACTREEHYTVAKELYRRIREHDGEISLSVCNHLIWVMGKAKKWWAALEVYEDLLDKGPEPNNMTYELIISHFNVLLTAARKRGIWRWGVRLLNKMQDKGLRPGSREWNSVLVACSKAYETSAAVEIFRRMVEQGEKPTVVSYGALLSALEKAKLYDEALRVWDHMCKVGVKPNVHAYTILVSIYIGKGKPEMIDVVFSEMQSSNIEPTVVTFNAMITGCAKNNLGASAFEWFNQMQLRNIKPNEITYEMLIEALAQDGKPRLAFEMYLRAYKEGLRLSSKSYDAVTEVCKSHGTDIDLHALGPRPFEKKKNVVIRKNNADFCHLADLRKKGIPFERAEVYASHVQD